jgi:hypothetical protein
MDFVAEAFWSMKTEMGGAILVAALACPAMPAPVQSCLLRR